MALVFDFVNGWNDSANAIATVVSTWVLAPLTAVLFAAVLNFGGALISTRLTQEHRIVYLVRGERIDFLQARYHY